MRISVLIPTYRRPEDLRRCLEAIRAQARPADEVIVTIRDTDELTAAFLQSAGAGLAPGKTVVVAEPGVVAAMNAGLAAATGDVIALTDDDAAPWPDWLGRIDAHFRADSQLGGLGGRDWQYKGGGLDDGRAVRCGVMNWWGRVSSGHHHAAPGPPHEVVVVKGVNCAYRAGPLREIGFDTRMVGGGAQVHWELSLGLALRRAGWRLRFDPALGVDHFPAVRFDEDQRCQFNAAAQRNLAYNEALVLTEHLTGVRRLAYRAWAAAVGTRATPGILQVPRLLLLREPNAGRRWWATARGQWAGARASRRSAILASRPVER